MKSLPGLTPAPQWTGCLDVPLWPLPVTLCVRLSSEGPGQGVSLSPPSAPSGCLPSSQRKLCSENTTQYLYLCKDLDHCQYAGALRLVVNLHTH